MIRIIHFVSSVNINSGVMSVLMNYYRNVDKSKIQFDFVYFTENDTQNYKNEILSMCGGGCYLVAAPNHNPLGFEKDIHRLYKEHYGEYYAVHLHDTFLPFFLLDCKRKIGAKKLIVHAHLTSYGDVMSKSFRNYLLSLPKYLIADRFWACSHEAGYTLAGKKTFERKGKILNNAIRLSDFTFSQQIRDYYREMIDISDDFVVGHVGHFSQQKNHVFLIEVFRKVLNDMPNAKLVLIGEGLERANIEKQCKELGIDDAVHFLGIRNDVNKILNAFDVFCFPSLYEGLPVSLLEAQAIGIPCIYADTITSEVNILKAQNKILSLNDSYEQWSDAIISAVKKYEDPQQELRTAGFDIQIEADKIVDYYVSS